MKLLIIIESSTRILAKYYGFDALLPITKDCIIIYKGGRYRVSCTDFNIETSTRTVYLKNKEK